MRIAIDARLLSHPQKGGFKTYTTELARALVDAGAEHRYLFVLDRPVVDDRFRSRPHVEEAVLSAAGGWLSVPVREQVRLPRLVRKWNPDILHFPCATGSLVPTAGVLVVTIHDAIEILERPGLSRPLREAMRRILMNQYSTRVQRGVARHARIVITDSEHSKRDLMQLLSVPEKKIRVIPLAAPVGGASHPDPGRVSIRERYNLPGSFVLAQASASPRKNVGGLLRTFARLPQEVRGQFPLCVVWSHTWLQASVSQAVRELGLGDTVRFLPNVRDDELADLYRAATVFVYPSLYEGFGLPVLEAMSMGVPVVASNLTSVPEVAGNAALLADPRDEIRFAQTLLDALEDPGLRARLAEAGLRQSQRFSWERTASMTIEAYREALDLARAA